MITFNLSHLIFLHGLLANLYYTKGLDKKMHEFVHDLALLHEMYIDDVNNEKVKTLLKYKPLKSTQWPIQDDDAVHAPANAVEQAKNEVQPINSDEAE